MMGFNVTLFCPNRQSIFSSLLTNLSLSLEAEQQQEHLVAVISQTKLFFFSRLLSLPKALFLNFKKLNK